jgi:hypothetical protein
MKKLKLIFNKLFSFSSIKKTEEPKVTDISISKEPDSNYVGNFGKDQCGDEEEVAIKPTEKVIISQPYMIKVENTTEESIEDVLLFFANNQDESAFNSNGDYIKNGIIISCEIPNISYRQTVRNFISSKENIGLTYMVSTNRQQLLEPFLFKNQNPNGNTYEKLITPVFSPEQYQQNIMAVKEDYFLDGNSSIIFKKVYPKTSVIIYFHPTE